MKLQRMNLSVFWHQGWMGAEPLAKPALSRSQYHQLAGAPRAMQTGPLTFPWAPNKGQRFWESYLSAWRSLESIGKEPAWRALVPLRSAQAPLRVIADADDVKVLTEGFLHPWGGTFVVRLKLTGEWPDLPSAARRVLGLRSGRRFSLAGGDGKELLLDDLAQPGLSALRELAPGASPGSPTEGFTVFALLDAEGQAAEFDPAVEATGAARFLHAVTSFRPTWEVDALPSLAKAKVAGRETGPKTHLVYGSARARAIWSPAAFAPTAAERESLRQEGKRNLTVSCHHRNLTLVSMQTESLSRLALDVAARNARGTRLDSEHEQLARCAVGRLGDLYRGTATTTYRSGSPQAQIDQGGYLDAINRVRVAGEMAKIP